MSSIFKTELKMIKIESGRLAVISDIHANFFALGAVRADAESGAGRGGVRYCCNGDCVVLGPEPKKCMEELRAMKNIDFIMGNNERYLVEKPYSNGRKFHSDTFAKIPEGYLKNLEWTERELGPEPIAFASKFAKTIVYDFLGKTICVSHGSPFSDEDIVTPMMPESEMLAKFGEYDYYVFGHTHRPFAVKAGRRHYINAGSVGAPLDGDRRAAYLLFEARGNELSFEIRRVEYDIDAVVDSLKTKPVPWSEALLAMLKNASIGM